MRKRALPVEAFKPDDEVSRDILLGVMDGLVPEKYYRALYGETATAIRQRIQNGKWKEGVHFHTPDGSGRWIHLPSVRRWVAGK